MGVALFEDAEFSAPLTARIIAGLPVADRPADELVLAVRDAARGAIEGDAAATCAGVGLRLVATAAIAKSVK